MDTFEKEQIVNEILEEVLLRIPDVLGNLIRNHSQSIKRKEEFFKQNPDFNRQDIIIAKVIQELEDKNPDWDYNKILLEAPKIIRERKRVQESLSMTKEDIVSAPVFRKSSNNGVL